MGTASDNSDVEAHGVVIKNKYRVPDTDLLILVTDQNAARLRFHADEYGAPSKRHCCYVSPQIKENTLTSQLDAVRHAYSHSLKGSLASSLHRMLMHDGISRPRDTSNPWREVRSSFDEYSSCFSWSPSQRQAIEGSYKLQARAPIVLGPSGSGKTSMQVKKGLILTRRRHYKMVYLSECNSVADNTLDQILEASLLQAKSEFLAMFVKGEDDQGEPSVHPDYPDAVDMVKYMNDFRAKVDEHSLDEESPRSGMMPLPYWSDREITLTSQANDYLRVAVLQMARILISTNQNCSAPDIRDCFASSDGDKVFVESDECFAATEPSSLIPIATTAFARNIISIVYYGNETQMEPVPLGTTRLFGQDETRFNEFHAQLQCSLVEHMIKSGFPVHRIDYQGRCHPILFAPVSSYYFGGRIDSPEPDSPRFALSPEYREQLRAVLRLPVDAKLSDEQERMVHVKVRSQQPCQQDTGGSRGNYSSFRYIITTMLPAFDNILGDDMHAKLLIVTPYVRQAEMWQEWCDKQLRGKIRTRKQLPKITTVGSSETDHAEHVIADLVIDGEDRDHIGFIKDNKHFYNLATRAKSTMWQVMSEDTGEERYGRIAPSSTTQAKATAPVFVNESGGFNRSKKAFWSFINWYTRDRCIWHLDNDESFDFFNAPRDLMLPVERDALERLQAVIKEQAPTAVGKIVAGDLTGAQTKQLRGIAAEIADEQWQAEHPEEESAYELWKVTVIRS